MARKRDLLAVILITLAGIVAKTFYASIDAVRQRRYFISERWQTLAARAAEFCGQFTSANSVLPYSAAGMAERVRYAS